jgi:hypothetical protein
MHVEQPPRSGAFVQVVDILCDDEKLARPFGIEPGEGPVGGIGFDGPQLLAAGVLKSLDQSRVPAKSVGRRDVLDPVPLPQPVRAPEGGEAALRRDSGAGEDDDVSDLAHGPL